MKDPVLATITRLQADASIVALVGDRIYSDELPLSPAYPAITVNLISDINDDNTHNSTAAHARIQCTSWAAGVGSGVARDLSQLIKKSLHRLTNTVLPSGTDPVPVISIFDAGSHPDVNPDVNPKIWMEHRDFVMNYKN